jgi:hypothetical protein
MRVLYRCRPASIYRSRGQVIAQGGGPGKPAPGAGPVPKDLTLAIVGGTGTYTGKRGHVAPLGPRPPHHTPVLPIGHGFIVCAWVVPRALLTDPGQEREARRVRPSAKAPPSGSRSASCWPRSSPSRSLDIGVAFAVAGRALALLVLARPRSPESLQRTCPPAAYRV